MARIPFASRDGLSPRTLKALGALPDIGIFRLLAQADGSFTAFSAFTGSLWNDAELSPRRRELVILLVARLAGCEYEWFQHEPVARMCGVTDSEIDALRELDLEPFDEGERAMLALARTTLDRGRPPDDELAAAREALTDREVIELQLVVAVYAGLAAIMVGLDLELDEKSGADQLARDEQRGPRLGD